MREAELATFFLRNGYVRMPGTLPAPLMSQIEVALDREFSAKHPPARYNAVGEISRIDSLVDRDPVFLEALRHSRVASLLVALLGPDVEVVRDRHNQAALNRAGDIPFRLHRDVRHWSRPVVSVFVYVDDATVLNGCTHVVPGSQSLPYAGPQSNDGGGTWADEHESFHHLIGQELPVPMPRGGVLLIDALAFHSVGVNRTTHSRRSMVFACHSADDLQRVHDGRELLFGERRYRGSSVQTVSGSLTASRES